MSTALTMENKSSFALSMETKGSNTITWAQATFDWTDASGTWDSQGIAFTRETKNSLSLAMENKN